MNKMANQSLSVTKIIPNRFLSSLVNTFVIYVSPCLAMKDTQNKQLTTVKGIGTNMELSLDSKDLALNFFNVDGKTQHTL